MPSTFPFLRTCLCLAAVATALAAAPSTPPGDSAEAMTYRLGPKPFDRAEINRLLDGLGFKDPTRPESTAAGWVYRDRSNAGKSLLYDPAADGFVTSYQYADTTVPDRSPSNQPPDSLVPPIADSLLRTVLRDRAGRWEFDRCIGVSGQKRQAGAKPGPRETKRVSTEAQYRRRLEGRVVQADAYAVRLRIGAANRLQGFILREASAAPLRAMMVPTPAQVIDSLKRWDTSTTRPRTLYVPHLSYPTRIRSIRPLRVFESFVSDVTGSPDPGKPGRLIPGVTVMAEATIGKRKKKPQTETIEYFFPCVAGSALCWPDGAEQPTPTAGKPSQIPLLKGKAR